MTIYLEAPLDRPAARIYEQTEEFSRTPPEDVIDVTEGHIGTGTITNRFSSEGFECCSGIVFENASRTHFALWHSYPGQELTDQNIKDLRPLQDGYACLIQGSGSLQNKRLLRDLYDSLGITLTDTISAETRRDLSDPGFFRAEFRPTANQILVARISYRDILTFPAFKHG